jgi:hypothetical protein
MQSISARHAIGNARNEGLLAPWRLQACRFPDRPFQSANVVQIVHPRFSKAEMQSEASFLHLVVLRVFNDAQTFIE